MRTLSGFLIVGILTALPRGANLRPYGGRWLLASADPQPVPGSSLGGVQFIRSCISFEDCPHSQQPIPAQAVRHSRIMSLQGRAIRMASAMFRCLISTAPEADTDANRQQAVHQNWPAMTQAFVMAEQIGEMRSEIKQLKSQASTENASAPALQPAIAPATETDDLFPESPVTVIVLRNGSRFETENYAIETARLNILQRPCKKSR